MTSIIITPYLFLSPFVQVPKTAITPDTLVTNVTLDTRAGPIKKFALDFPPMRYGDLLRVEAAGCWDSKDGRWYLTHGGRAVAEIDPAYISWMRREDVFDDEEQGDTAELVGPPSWDNVDIPARITEELCVDHQAELANEARRMASECRCE